MLETESQAWEPRASLLCGRLCVLQAVPAVWSPSRNADLAEALCLFAMGRNREAAETAWDVVYELDPYWTFLSEYGVADPEYVYFSDLEDDVRWGLDDEEEWGPIP